MNGFAKPFFHPRNASRSEQSVKIAFSSNELNGSSKNVVLSLDNLKTFGLRSLSAIHSGFGFPDAMEMVGKIGPARPRRTPRGTSLNSTSIRSFVVSPERILLVRAERHMLALRRLVFGGPESEPWRHLVAISGAFAKANLVLPRNFGRNGSLANVYNENVFADRPMYRRRFVSPSRNELIESVWVERLSRRERNPFCAIVFAVSPCGLPLALGWISLAVSG